MKTNRTLLLVVLLALASSATACKPVSQEKRFKMQQSTGRMTGDTDIAYYAICNTIVPGSHADVWVGEKWHSKDRAMRDAVEHNKQYPGHEATFRK